MAANNTVIINKFGSLAGWNSMQFRWFNRTVEGITELEYNDETDMDNEYGAGGFPVGQSEMNYKTGPNSVTVYMEELLAMQASAPKGTRLQQFPPIDVPVQYVYQGKIYEDVLRNVRIKGNGRQVKQGDGKILVKLTLLISHIDWAQ